MAPSRCHRGADCVLACCWLAAGRATFCMVQNEQRYEDCSIDLRPRAGSALRLGTTGQAL